jgi:hypothetical protein
MADTTVTTQSPAPPHFQTFRGKVSADISVDPGTPVTTDPSGGDIIFSRANAGGTANVAGLASSAGEAPGNVNVQYGGPLTLTTEQWDARTGGSGGLTPGDVYYLSAATAGLLTTTPPVNPNYITPIGFALSATTMQLQIGIAVPQT